VEVKDGRFYLRRDFVERGDVRAARAAFRDYYVLRGRQRITKRVKYYAPKVGVEPRGVEVRDLGYRWASCSPTGRLAFHWKCMMAPPKIIDYIVAHELCHIHQGDHRVAFWNEVDKILADFEEWKEWLRKNGAGLDI